MDPVSPAQSRAAFAYARTLLEPGVADAAAEDALSAFRQAMAGRSATAAGDGGAQSETANTTLLALTRLMTAVSVPDRSSPADRRQAVWASIGHSSHCTCRESAALLATRANGNIQPRESAALDDHLASCADCRELSVRGADAEAAFRRELIPPRGPSGFGLPSVPRAAYGALGLIVAVVLAIVLLSGSHSSTSRAAVAPVQTQASAALTTAATAPKPTKPAAAVHRHAVVRRAPKPSVKLHRVRHTPAVTQTTVTPAPATTATAPVSTPTSSATAGATGSTGEAADSATSSGSGLTSGATAAASAPTSSTATPASASVAGSTSLPADSAPQQGIGSQTSTTP